MNRLLLFLAVLLQSYLFGTGVFGQVEKGVVHLKGGSKLKGLISRVDEENALNVNVSGLSEEIVVPFEYIKWFKSKAGSYRDTPMRPRGYYNYSYLGLIFMKASEFTTVEPGWTLHTINGYRINPLFTAGIGIGLDRYGGVSSAPIYLSFNADITTSRYAPFVNLAVGGAPMWESKAYNDFLTYEQVQGGFYYSLGGGLKVNYFKSALVIMLSYKHQNAKMEVIEDWWWGWGSPSQTQEIRKFKNLSLSVGMSF